MNKPSISKKGSLWAVIIGATLPFILPFITNTPDALLVGLTIYTASVIPLAAIIVITSYRALRGKSGLYIGLAATLLVLAYLAILLINGQGQYIDIFQLNWVSVLVVVVGGWLDWKLIKNDRSPWSSAWRIFSYRFIQFLILVTAVAMFYTDSRSLVDLALYMVGLRLLFEWGESQHWSFDQTMRWFRPVLIIALVLIVIWHRLSSPISQDAYLYEPDFADLQNTPSHDQVSLDISKVVGSTVSFTLTNNSQETIYYSDSNCASQPFSVFEVKDQTLYRVADNPDICAVMPSEVPVAAGKTASFTWLPLKNTRVSNPIRIEMSLSNENKDEYRVKTEIVDLNK